MTKYLTLEQFISTFEGRESLLYSDPSNPYESIYIRAGVKNGELTITDSECEHAPDGGWSHLMITFDKMNTQKVFLFLLKKNPNPFAALQSMFNYTDRTRMFQQACKDRGIQFTCRLSI